MNFSFSNIVALIKELLFTPAIFWKREKEALTSGKNLWFTYLMPMLLALAIAVFVAEFLRRDDFFIQYPLLVALREIVLFGLTYYFGVIITSELMKSFGAEKNKDIARKLVVYSMTPLVLVSIVTGLFPFLYVVEIVGLYSFYLFWIGAKELLIFTDKREQSYILITSFANFFVFSLLSIVLSKLLNAYSYY